MRIAGWILGILVIFLALSILRAEQMIVGSLFLVAGVIALPPFLDKVNKRREADGKSPFLQVYSLIPAGCILIFSCIVLVSVISDPKVSVRSVPRGLTPQAFDHRFNNYMADYDTQLGMAVRSNLAGGEITKGNSGNFFTIQDASMRNQRMYFLAKMSTDGILTEVYMANMVRNRGATKESSAFRGFISAVAFSGIMGAFDSTLTEEERLEIVGLLVNRVDFCNGETRDFIRSGVQYWSWCDLEVLGVIHVGAKVVE